MKTKSYRLGTFVFVVFALVINTMVVRTQTIYTPYTFTNYAGQPGGPGYVDGTDGGARFRSPAGVAIDATGNLYVTDQNNFMIRMITSAGVVATVAGSPGQPGTTDGTGSAARFGSAIYGGPIGIAVDTSGNVYVADTFNNTIRKIAPGGIVSTFAGSAGLSGSSDGTGTAARFGGPQGLAVDSAGNVYVADTGNYTIRKITPAGVVTTIAGTPGQSGTTDGTNSAARFGYAGFGGPIGLAVDANMNVYVADTYNSTIRKISPSGTDWVVSTVAGAPRVIGFSNGTNQSALFDNPWGVSVDSGGNIYVTDSPAETIRKITVSGTNYVVSTPAGTTAVFGSVDGIGSAALFLTPKGAAVDNAGNLYVVDSGNDTIRKLTPSGTNFSVTTFAGRAGGVGSLDGIGNAAQFYLPQGVALDAATNLYVADDGNSLIRQITPTRVVTTIAGSAGTKGLVDGVGFGTPQFNLPTGISADGASNLYLADSGNQTIRKITPAGVVTTFAGQPGISGSQNGAGSGASFNQPVGTAVDSSGNVYVSDQVNRTIRMITPGGTVSTFAGTKGVMGTNDGLGTSAQFMMTISLAVDTANNIYVVDSGADTIRKITPAGLVTTLAGKGKSSGTNDGVGSSARFFNPFGVAVDTSGNVYVTDTANHTIRMIAPDQTVTTVAGAPTLSGSNDGTNGSARFSSPRGITVDAANNLYVCDSGNSTIRKITHSGTNWVVTTLAGAAGQRGNVDSTNSAARFQVLYGIAVDGAGNLYPIDRNVAVIRKVTPTGTVTTFAGTTGQTGSADGTGAEALFDQPSGVVVDSASNIYVADALNYVVRKISPVGTNWQVTTLAGNVGQLGTNDGTGKAALFSQIHGVAVDGAHNVYVADLGNLTIRKITPAGVVTTIAGTPGKQGILDGIGSAARFNGPVGIVSDAGGNLFVTDGFSIREVSTGAVVTTLAGCPSGGCTDAIGNVDGSGLTARFGFPIGIALDGAGNIYVADAGNDTIRKLTGSGTSWNVTTLGGVPGEASYADGTGDVARFNYPYGVAVDGARNVYVGDSTENHIAKGFLAGSGQPVFQFDTTGGSLVVSNGTFQMHVSGPSSGSVVLETSTNLTTWTPIQTNSLASGGVVISTPVTPDQHRFYRAIYVP